MIIGSKCSARKLVSCLTSFHLRPLPLRNFLSCLHRLADAMFGDESDEDAKGPKGEYTYKPKKKTARKNQDHSDDDARSDDATNDGGGGRKTPKEGKVNEKNISRARKEFERHRVLEL